MTNRFITLLAGLLLTSAAYAQVEVQDYDALRRNSWSLYGKGGVSAALGGNLIQDVNPVRGGRLTPMAGIGADYNIRPWIRVGIAYDFSQFTRSQRFSAIQEDGSTYRFIDALLHRADVTADFNLMELWPKRGSKRFNLYLGTGAGWIYGYGYDYGIKVGNDVDITSSSVNIRSWLAGHNGAVKLSSPYIPLNLSAEYDIRPRLTLGFEIGGNCFLKKNNYTPGTMLSAALSLRINLVGHKHGCTSRKEIIRKLRVKAHELEQESQEKSRTIAGLEDQVRLRDAEIAALKERLKELERRIDELEAGQLMSEAFVYFEHDSSEIDGQSQEVISLISDFLVRHPDFYLDLTGSASKVGDSEYNMELSRRRAQNVRKHLLESGVNPSQIIESWVGDQGMTSSAKSRRVSFIFLNK